MKSLLNLRHIFGAPLAFAPGHFYSPICSPADLGNYRDPNCGYFPPKVAGIDLNGREQNELWEEWRTYLAEFPFPDVRTNFRYYCHNFAFGVGDAMILYSMLRYFCPKRFIEIGSGFSSACALDTIERYLDGSVECTFIEPFPELLYSLMKANDMISHTLIASQVQDVSSETFDQLESGDILFIDSTHILKTGSDVAFELFEILPRLKSGVIVHFHDIFYPFEYPREWVIERNYSWNEIYAIRAFLTGNRDFRILFFNDYFAKAERETVEMSAPRMLGNPGGGLWLQKA